MTAEYRHRTKQGAWLSVETRGKRLPDGSIVGFIRDISERKHVEETLRESEERFRALIENAPETIR